MLRGFYYSVAVAACCATSALGQQAGGLSEADAKQAASMISKAWDDAYRAVSANAESGGEIPILRVGSYMMMMGAGRPASSPRHMAHA